MPNRRTLLKVTAAGLLSCPRTGALAALKLTPAATEGPFYPVDIPLDADADLVQVEGMSRPATGVVTHVIGKVVDANGAPIAGARVEIWQCDAFGAYKHPRDRGDVSEAEFQGYGFTDTTDQGEYRFRTIRPVSYPGRTPHIHAKITAPGMPTLTTQFYVEGEEQNRRDFLYRRVPDDRKAMVTARFPVSEAETDSVIPRIYRGDRIVQTGQAIRSSGTDDVTGAGLSRLTVTASLKVATGPIRAIAMRRGSKVRDAGALIYCCNARAWAFIFSTMA